MTKFSGFNNAITFWFNENKRNLPWRNTKDPYKIWVSEIILQQTRVNQGIEYYKNFIRKFKNINALAGADINEVLKIWQGLGYYSRARNMHETAKKVVREMGGIFPAKYEEIIKLKGIGKYTAAAIASICFGESIPVVDGNVYRVISRYKGISTMINSNSAYSEFYSTVKKLMSTSEPGTFNQSVMELGAIICTPKKPDCKQCPVAKGCYARKNNKIDLLPAKSKNTKVRKRYFNYLVISNNENILIKKRVQNDIWKSLFDFPLIESKKNISVYELLHLDEFRNNWKFKKIDLLNISKTYEHKLTHQIIYARFYKFKLSDSEMPVIPDISMTKLKQLHSFPVPRLVDKYLSHEFGIQK
jgi:A/G-specific adenine glycosylase